MSAWDTIEREAKTGNPEAWKMLSGAAHDNNTAREILLKLEKSGIKPKFEPNLPDIRPFKLPSLIKMLGHLTSKSVERRIDRGNSTLGV